MLKVGQAVLYRDCQGQMHDGLVTHVASQTCVSLVFLDPQSGAVKQRMNIPHGSLAGWTGGNYFGDANNDAAELIAHAKAMLRGEKAMYVEPLRRLEGVVLQGELLHQAIAVVEALAAQLGLTVEPKAKPEGAK